MYCVIVAGQYLEGAVVPIDAEELLAYVATRAGLWLHAGAGGAEKPAHIRPQAALEDAHEWQQERGGRGGLVATYQERPR